ncbi:hypothetical protein HK096_005955 [Nowakowskiella sp. JEL0078]|nr:hypothetical protein HK096_005955 [Nowakowskiella sp. JEL0078]
MLRRLLLKKTCEKIIPELKLFSISRFSHSISSPKQFPLNAHFSNLFSIKPVSTLIQRNHRLQFSSKREAAIKNPESFIDTDAWVGEWKSKIKQLKRAANEVMHIRILMVVALLFEADSIEVRKEMLHGSQKVVALAITSNLIMFSGKLYAALISGSSSMALHSLADVINEWLVSILMDFSNYFADN